MELNRILTEFEIESTSINSDFTIPEAELPKQYVNGKVVTKAGRHRCDIIYQTIENQGRYGIIQACRRIESGTTIVAVVKRPRSSSISLAAEAVLQALCYACVNKHGLAGSVSKPYDLFLFANEVRFTMEYIEGMSFKKFIEEKCEAEIMNCIMQLCCILLILGEHLNFDHRDLRIENIWIRSLTTPKTYKIQIDGLDFQFEFKFQVVLLDFGFACIGDATRMALVNLGNSVFSPIDPCPKFGRDIYQFLNSCLENKIQEKLSPTMLETIRNWMKPYKPIASALTYITTYDPKFELNKLTPINLLRWFLAKKSE